MGLLSPCRDFHSEDLSHLDSLHNLSRYLETSLKQTINQCSFQENSTILDEGDYRLSISKFNSLFTGQGYSSTETFQDLCLNEEFKEIIKKLQSIDLRKYEIVFLYPLARKILIVTEGHLIHTLKNQSNKKVSSLIPDIKEGDPLCCTLDSFYRENNVVISKNDLSRSLDYTGFTPESSLDSLEIFSRLFSNDGSYDKQISTDDCQFLLSVILFNYIQKVVALLLVSNLLINVKVDSGVNGSFKNLNNDISNSETKIERTLRLVISVLKTPESWNGSTFVESWSFHLYSPVQKVLCTGLVISTSADHNDSRLMEILVLCLNTFSSVFKDDPSRTLANLEGFLYLLSNKLAKLSSKFKEYFDSVSNQLLSSIRGKRDRDLSRSNSSISTNSSSRDLSTILQKNSLKNFMNDYFKLWKALSKLMLSLGELKHFKFKKNFYGLLESLTCLISSVVSLILIGDSLEYVTKKSSNQETSLFIRETTENMSNLIGSLLKNSPFDVSNALFYYLGSNFNDKNLPAQMYVFNRLTYNKLRGEERKKYIKMLDSILKGSKDYFVNPFNFEKTKGQSNQLKVKYLSIKFSNICMIFLHETNSSSNTNLGIMDLFASWCYSSNIYENLLSRQMCKFMSRLIEVKHEYIGISMKLMDTVLGLCFFTSFDDTNEIADLDISRGSEFEKTLKLDNMPYIKKVKYRQKICFKNLKMFSSSPLISWLMENVVLSYTCVFVDIIRQLIKPFHIKCNCGLCEFKCYYKNEFNSECQCLDTPIVNNNPSVFHYLELMGSIDFNNHHNWDEKTQNITQFILETLKNGFARMVKVLVETKEKGDVESKLAMFKTSIKLANILVSTGEYKLSGSSVSCLNKLFSLLGSPQICKAPGTEHFVKVISQILGILHIVLLKWNHDQLMELHRGLLTALTGKIPRYPDSLSRIHFYQKNNPTMAKRYTELLNPISQNVDAIESHTLKVIYTYYMWKFFKNNSIEDQKNEFFKNSKTKTREEQLEMKIRINLLFTLARQVKEVTQKWKTNGTPVNSQ